MGRQRGRHITRLPVTTTRKIALQKRKHNSATLNADPDFAPAYHDLGQLYLRYRRVDDGHRVLVRYLQRAPTPKARRETLQLLTTLVGDEPIQCEGCARKSPIASAFELVQKGSQEKLLCPRCRSPNPNKWFHQWGRNTLIWMGITAGIALITFPFSNFLHFAAANIFLLLLFLPIIIAVQEAIRALVTILLGGAVFDIKIGEGRLLWETEIRHCDLSVRQTFIRGGSWIGFPQKDHIVLRFFLAIIAPTLVQVVIFLLASEAVVFRALISEYQPLGSFALANSFLLLVTLYPHSYKFNGADEYSVGVYLLAFLQGRIPAEELLRLYYVRNAFMAMSSEAYERGLMITEAGLAHFPNESNLLRIQTACLTWMGKYEAARSQYNALLARNDVPQTDKGVACNNFSWALLLDNKPHAALEEARRAYALVPWLYFVESSLGAALIECGESQSGIDLILEGEKVVTYRRHHASHFAHIALGYAQLGNSTESQRYWEQALKLDPTNTVIAPIRPKLASMGMIQ